MVGDKFLLTYLQFTSNISTALRKDTTNFQFQIEHEELTE